MQFLRPEEAQKAGDMNVASIGETVSRAHYLKLNAERGHRVHGGREMRGFSRLWLLSVCVTFVPAVVYGQASIAGVVRDTSGAVLPGVTVEAASPALIERVRSVVTDGTGQYRIVDLRPG